MSDKTPIRLRIVSESSQEKSEQTVLADQYKKNGAYYVRYAEAEAEMGRTMTTIRLEPGRIRLLRQGDVQTELTFEAGRRHCGTYHAPQGRLELETETQALTVQWEDGGGTAAWSYELYAAGESAGRFALTITAVAEGPFA